ncbi:MAG: hypothetical protein RLZZ53_86 [Acidobacteriota bacterium]|jgi:uncharacterized tellurite resistance protein B-like protein
MLKSIQGWLGLSEPERPSESAPLRELLNALDRLEPSRAQYLARFAYLLGRVARADDHVSDAETKAMEQVLAEHGGLSAEQAMLVVSLAKATHAMLGVSADFAITQEFTDATAYDERLALARCLFAVAASDARISTAEEAEVHRITNQLRIERPDLTEIRLQYKKALPGIG